MAYLTADLRRDSELLRVDGEPITAEEYLFWLVNSISVQKQLGYLSNDAAWEETLGDNGVPTGEFLKEDALDTAKLYRIIRTKAEQAGVTLTENDRMEMETHRATAIAQVGGEEAFQLWLDSSCISDEAFSRFDEVYYLNQGLEDLVEGAEEYAEEQGVYAAKHILLSTRRRLDDGSYEDYTDEEKAEVLEKITGIRDQIVSASDQEAKFDELMNEYSEDGRDENGNLYAPEGYPFVYPGEMVSEFEKGALALSVGEVSQPVQTKYGYHLILRIAPDEELAREAKLAAQTDEWVAQAEVVPTKAYEELDPKAFYERLVTVIDARMAAQATPTPEASADPEGTPVG